MNPRRIPLALALAASLLLAAPAAAATLHPGDLLILDIHHVVYHVDMATRQMTWVAAANLLAAPHAIAVHPDGRILVTDATNGVVAIDPGSGVQSVLSSGGLFEPAALRGIAVEPDGHILLTVAHLTATGAPAVVRMDAAGGSQSVLTSRGLLHTPDGMTIAPDGALYVCDPSGVPDPLYTNPHAAGTIVRVALATGEQLGQITSEQFTNPFAIAWSPATGRLIEIQRGVMGHCYYGGAFWVDPVTGAVSVAGLAGGPCYDGIAAGSHRLAYSTWEYIQHDPYYPYTVAADTTYRNVGGPLALVPEKAPPECGQARASITELWPPDGRMVPVEILGVTDPDGDPVTISYDRVTQDEPAGGGGAGGTCSDARMVDGRLELRAERSGQGNGRVYAIAFSGSDGRGGTCQGTVSVCVPHDRGPDRVCVDDGQEFNSLRDCRRAIGPVESLGGTREGVGPELRLELASSGASRAVFRYALPKDAEVSLAVHDLAGRRVATLARGWQSAGWHEASWSTSGLTSGIYFCRIRTVEESASRAVPVLR